jgi:hypothetical protein
MIRATPAFQIKENTNNFSVASFPLNVESSSSSNKYGTWIYSDGKTEPINEQNLLTCLSKIIHDKDIHTFYNAYDYDNNLRCNECDKYTDEPLKGLSNFKSQQEYTEYLQARNKNTHHLEKDNNVLHKVKTTANGLSNFFNYKMFVLSLASDGWLTRIKDNQLSEPAPPYHGAVQKWSFRELGYILVSPDKCKPNTRHIKDATKKIFKQKIDKNHDFVLMTGDSVECDIGLVANCLLEGIPSLAIFNVSHLNQPAYAILSKNDVNRLSKSYFEPLQNNIATNIWYIPPVALTSNMAELRELQSLVVQTVAKIKKDSLINQDSPNTENTKPTIH